MKMLTAEITKLLDKLYNLRGEDSVILLEMEKERTKAEETKERTTSEKQNLQEKITSLSEEENVLASEGDRLIKALSNIRGKEFKYVLDKLNIDFDPDKLGEDVSNMLPKTIEHVQEDKESAKNELVKVEEEMNTAVATIEELAIRKDEALADQTRLNEIIDLSLNGNVNITRDSITSLLEKFDFSEDEQREAAKIIMFPEDALFDYDSSKKEIENPGKSISEVFAEAKETADEKIELEKYAEPMPVETEDYRLAEEDSPKDKLDKLLKELGFDFMDFTNNDIDKILDNYDKETIVNNVNYAKEKDLKLDLFIDNIELLYDKEFKDKVDKLIEIGKEPFDIYLNPNILVKYSANELDDTINRLINSGLDPKKVPLIAY